MRDRTDYRPRGDGKCFRTGLVKIRHVSARDHSRALLFPAGRSSAVDLSQNPCEASDHHSPRSGLLEHPDAGPACRAGRQHIVDQDDVPRLQLSCECRIDRDRAGQRPCSCLSPQPPERARAPFPPKPVDQQLMAANPGDVLGQQCGLVEAPIPDPPAMQRHG